MRPNQHLRVIAAICYFLFQPLHVFTVANNVWTLAKFRPVLILIQQYYFIKRCLCVCLLSIICVSAYICVYGYMGICIYINVYTIPYVYVCMFIMMTSWNGYSYPVTGLLWGEFTDHRWIPLRKASDAELWCLLWSAPEQTVEQTIETLVIWDAIALIMRSP